MVIDCIGTEAIIGEVIEQPHGKVTWVNALVHLNLTHQVVVPIIVIAHARGHQQVKTRIRGQLHMQPACPLGQRLKQPDNVISLFELGDGIFQLRAKCQQPFSHLVKRDRQYAFLYCHCLFIY